MSLSLTQRDQREARAALSSITNTDVTTLTRIELRNALHTARMALSCTLLALHDAITEEKLPALTIAQLLAELEEGRVIIARCVAELYDGTTY